MSDEHFEGEGVGFYRCMMCGKANAPWELMKGKGCTTCGDNHMKPTNLSWLEKLRFIFKYPLVWKWEDALQTKKES